MADQNTKKDSNAKTVQEEDQLYVADIKDNATSQSAGDGESSTSIQRLCPAPEPSESWKPGVSKLNGYGVLASK